MGILRLVDAGCKIVQQGGRSMVLRYRGKMRQIMKAIAAEGWTRVSWVTDSTSLLKLAHMLGTPLPSPTGEIVKALEPIPSKQARPGTLSEHYGTGSFPLHTDTAFWPIPARYLIMRVSGDTRRQTLVLSADNFLGPAGSLLRQAAKRSVWIAHSSQSFYCSMLFRIEEEWGIRYDPHCLAPANLAAEHVGAALSRVSEVKRAIAVDWSKGGALILANWRVLHSRGPRPDKESKRILERIYVR